MKTVQVHKLIGDALDYIVATLEGYTGLTKDENEAFILLPPRTDYGYVYLFDQEFSTTWSQGGPIIEREGISLCYAEDNPKGMEWFAYTPIQSPDDDVIFAATPLVAAMRCYVASKLGDTVEVPDES